MWIYDCYFTRQTSSVAELVIFEADNDDEACAKAGNHFGASSSYRSVEVFGSGRLIARLHRSDDHIPAQRNGA